jgi:hypothetical protein
MVKIALRICHAGSTRLCSPIRAASAAAGVHLDAAGARHRASQAVRDDLSLFADDLQAVRFSLSSFLFAI